MSSKHPEIIISESSRATLSIMDASDWKALVISEVNEHNLFHGLLDGTPGKTVPVKTIHLPVDDPSTIAVLSWRWDGTDKMIGSRHIFSAIHQARKLGIEFLFIDVISIDQTLSADALLRQVVEFSKLYKSVQVIATYDGQEFNTHLKTIYRPWIFSEIQMFRHNPTRIIYVWHDSQMVGNVGTLLPSENYGRNSLRGIWLESFSGAVFGILTGFSNMVSVSDIRYIIPYHATLFEAAFVRMSRNDYLLTVAICCQVGKSDGRFGYFGNITNVSFDRYVVVQLEANGGWAEGVEIFLDGVPVVKRYLVKFSSNWNGYNLCAFELMENTAAVILASLGIEEFYDREFLEDAESVGEVVPAGELARIEEYFVDTDSFGLETKLSEDEKEASVETSRRAEGVAGEAKGLFSS